MWIYVRSAVPYKTIKELITLKIYQMKFSFYQLALIFTQYIYVLILCIAYTHTHMYEYTQFLTGVRVDPDREMPEIKRGKSQLAWKGGSSK